MAINFLSQGPSINDVKVKTPLQQKVSSNVGAGEGLIKYVPHLKMYQIIMPKYLHLLHWGSVIPLYQTNI